MGERGGGATTARRLRFSQTDSESVAQQANDGSSSCASAPAKLSNEELTARFFALQSQLSSLSRSTPPHSPSRRAIGKSQQTVSGGAQDTEPKPHAAHNSSSSVSETHTAPGNPHGSLTSPSGDQTQEGEERAEAEDASLRAQLQREIEYRRSLEQQLHAASNRASTAEAKLKEEYAQRLAAAATEPNDTEQASAPAEQLKHRLLRDGKRADVSADELERVQKHLQEQESLIQGYQAENEAAMQRLKSTQQQAREREEQLRAENSRLQAENNSLKASVPDHKENGQSLQRVLQLEQQLEQVTEDASAKQDELRRELNKTKDEKNSLEAKLQGIDMNALERDISQAQRAEERFAKEREHYEMKVADLQHKVDWYAENQALISEKEKTIAQLQQQLDEPHSHSKKVDDDEEDDANGSNSQQLGSKRLKQRVKELSNENNELRKAVEEKNPTSTAALLSAVRPKPEEAEHVQSLKKQVNKLKQDIKAKDEEKEATVRSLRQEYEKMKAQYDSQLKRARAQAASASGGSKSSRVKELEQQVSELRDFYGKKVKHLQSQLEQERVNSGASASTSKVKRGAHATTSSLRGAPAEKSDASITSEQQKEELFNDVEVQADFDDHALATEQSTKTEASVQVNLLPGAESSDPAAHKHRSSREMPVSSRQQPETELHSLDEDFDGQQNKRKALHQEPNSNTGWHSASRADGASGISYSKNEDDEARASKMARQQLQEAYSEAVERSAARIASLERQLDEARKQAEGISTEETERANKAERRVQELEQEKAELQQSLQPMSQRGQTELREIDNKLIEMQRGMPEDAWSYNGARERQWLWIAKQARRLGEAEAAEARADADRAVQAKNDELSTFRQELDAILAAALAHQEHQIDPAAHQHWFDGIHSKPMHDYSSMQAAAR